MEGKTIRRGMVPERASSKAQKAEATTTDNQEPKATALKKTVNPQYKFFPYTLADAGVT
jgi:hypothetical protein